MTDSRIGFGLLGTGLIAPFHARALQASRCARLVAAADLDGQRLEKFTAQFGCRGYARFEQMLADPEVQVVNVLTPNHLHHDAVLQAAAASRHVLIEKPPAMSLREVDSMIQACQKARVKAGVVLQCRTRKPVQAIRRAISGGRFGRLLQADTFMKWFRAPEYYRMDAWRMSQRAGAGVTIQQAFHYIDLLQYLAGPVTRVQAQMRNLTHPDVKIEDTLLSFVEYRSGALGVIEASTSHWPGTDMRIEINGENGTAIMVGERMDTWRFRDERPEDEAIRRYGSASVATGATGAADLGFHDHQAVIEDMVDSIATDREPMISLTSARPTLEWALAMYQSAVQGSPVQLPLADADGVLDLLSK
jgi:predicted dehydrogenase